MRQCPRCQTSLRPLFNGKTTLDHCGACRGNFFDVGKSKETFGDWTEPSHWLSTACASERTHHTSAALACPAGHGTMPAYLVHWEEEQVEVDVCATCKGMWLDATEGGRLAELMQRFQEASDAAAQNVGLKLYLFQLFTGFPVEVFHPVRRRPVAVHGLMGMLFLVFVLQIVAVSNGLDAAQPIMENWALRPAWVWRGEQLWTLCTHALLHGGAFHLLSNLYVLKIFGDNVEERLGAFRFLGLYAVALFAGAIAHLVAHATSEVPMVGASGAISGVMAAYLWYFPKVRLWMVIFFIRFQISAAVFLGFWTALQIGMATLGVPGVAWNAHLGGFAGGWAFLWVRYRVLRRYPVRYPGPIKP